eukprot:m.257869 g.257869  ORF g.257869 m.257869 type:complete len:237 (-) comp35802_c0_seq1:188-898(-)
MASAWIVLGGLVAGMSGLVVLASPAAPSLPTQWMHEGDQTLAFPLPPWTGPLPLPRIVNKMESWYDWDNKRMRETYHDMCVPIFPKGSMWSCDFLNVNNISYLLQHEDRAAGQPECCIFEKPWVPPRPTFGDTLFFKTTTTEIINNAPTKVQWWESKGVSVQDGGPFGYGWYESAKETLVPYAFYFGAFWNNANGTFTPAFTLQNWGNTFVAGTPPESVWVVPASCNSAKPCSNWP